MESSRQLTLLAPPFLAELLGAAPVPGTRLRVLPWDRGAPPVPPGDIDILVPWRSDKPATRSVISGLEPASWVCSVHAGIDWFVESVPPGVLVTSGQGLLSGACAEWVVAATLTLLRGLPDFADAQRARVWRRKCFGTLDGATVLLIGYGSIGRAVESMLAPFGCRIVRVAGHRRPGVATLADLPGLLGDTDVVALAVPLVPPTRRLVDAAFLGRMRAGSILVNVGRGELVDTAALAAALRAGRRPGRARRGRPRAAAAGTRALRRPRAAAHAAHRGLHRALRPPGRALHPRPGGPPRAGPAPAQPDPDDLAGQAPPGCRHAEPAG